MENLLSLPTETLVVLAAGYMAYSIAYTGMREGHKALDTTFLTLAFGLIAKVVFISLDPYLTTVEIKIAFSVTVALIAAAVWRKWARDWWLSVLRYYDISYSDGRLTAFDDIRTSTDRLVTQLTVHQTNGDVLRCGILHNFKDEPSGPCSFGEDGSVALYVTEFKKNGQTAFKSVQPKSVDTYWGSKMTYVPAGKVEKIAVRLSPA